MSTNDMVEFYALIILANVWFISGLWGDRILGCMWLVLALTSLVCSIYENYKRNKNNEN